MFKPTVGRVVWYWPTASDIAEGMFAYPGSSQPFAATVAFVHGERMVNLSVTDHRGATHEKRSVTLLQDGDIVLNAKDGYAEWMPYQKGQAAKTEAVAKEAFAAVTAAAVASHGVTDNAIEQEIQAKGLAAPRVTLSDIEANIAAEHYFTAGQALTALQHPVSDGLELLTFCVLVLRNGTKIVGINYGAIDPAQHSAQRGCVEARAHAIEQIWPLLGYELRSRLHQRAQFEAEPQVGYGNAQEQAQADRPHAAPFRYCPQCVASPCPAGLGQTGD